MPVDMPCPLVTVLSFIWYNAKLCWLRFSGKTNRLQQQDREVGRTRSQLRPPKPRVNFQVVGESGVYRENMIDMDVVTSPQSQTHKKLELAKGVSLKNNCKYINNSPPVEW